MKKPEFPNSRIISDSFLPEQEPMKNYRIKKVTKGNDIEYYPQKKILWFWWNIGILSRKIWCYTTYGLANDRILEDYQSHQKECVEYLEPTTSETVPNPPLRHP